MTEADRKYFQDKADIDKIRYLKEMKEFYDEVGRIGDRVGTMTTKDGVVNVVGTNQESESEDDA